MLTAIVRSHLKFKSALGGSNIIILWILSICLNTKFFTCFRSISLIIFDLFQHQNQICRGIFNQFNVLVKKMFLPLVASKTNFDHDLFIKISI